MESLPEKAFFSCYRPENREERKGKRGKRKRKEGGGKGRKREGSCHTNRESISVLTITTAAKFRQSIMSNLGPTVAHHVQLS
jgi:hypothetical protein